MGWSQWDLGDLSSRVCQLSVHRYCQLVWCVVSKRCPRACLFMHVWVCCVCMCVCMRAHAHLGLFLAQGSSICSTRVLPVEALSHAYGKEPTSPTVLDPPPPPLAPLHLACLDRPCQPLFYPREPWAIPRISLGGVGGGGGALKPCERPSLNIRFDTRHFLVHASIAAGVHNPGGRWVEIILICSVRQNML